MYDKWQIKSLESQTGIFGNEKNDQKYTRKGDPLQSTCILRYETLWLTNHVNRQFVKVITL